MSMMPDMRRFFPASPGVPPTENVPAEQAPEGDRGRQRHAAHEGVAAEPAEAQRLARGIQVRDRRAVFAQDPQVGVHIDARRADHGKADRLDRVERRRADRADHVLAAELGVVARLHRLVELRGGLFKRFGVRSDLRGQIGQAVGLEKMRVLAEPRRHLLAGLQRDHRRVLPHGFVEDHVEREIRQGQHRPFDVVDAGMVLAHEPLALAVHVKLPGTANGRVQAQVSARQRVVGVLPEAGHGREERVASRHRGAQFLRRPDAVAARVRIAIRGQRELRRDFRPHLEVRRVAPRRKDDVASVMAFRGSARRFDFHAGHGARLVLNQPGESRFKPEIDAAVRDQLLKRGRHGLENAHAQLLAPAIAPRAVGLMGAAGDRMPGQGLETQAREPVQRVARVFDRHAPQRRVHRAVADAHRVLVVLLGAVIDPGGLLQPGPGRAHLPRRPEQRPPDPIVRLDLQHPARRARPRKCPPAFRSNPPR